MRKHQLMIFSCGVLLYGQTLAADISQSARPLQNSSHTAANKASNVFDESTTFRSFYRKDAAIGWPMVVGTAIAGGAAVFLTGGLAAPAAVTSFASSIGSMMGYSGIAATNAGMAWLGGGSLAAGGLGMAGGAAVATAGLGAGTGAALDYSIEKVLVNNEYSYKTFAEQSQRLNMLPLPINTTGPDSYEATLEILENGVDKQKPLSDQANQKVIKAAIGVLRVTKGTNEDIARIRTLLALLYFVSNDYGNAKQISSSAHRRGFGMGTLPAFIYSTSLLYDDAKSFRFAQAMKYFKWSIDGERDNPLTPWLFSIFLDRLTYRMSNGFATTENLDQVYGISKTLNHDKRKQQIQLGLNERYLNMLGYEFLKIQTLTHSENSTIKKSKETLNDVKLSLANYEKLLKFSRAAITGQSAVLESRKNTDPSLLKQSLDAWNEMIGADSGPRPQWEVDWGENIAQHEKKLSQLEGKVEYLKKSITDLEEYQSCWIFCG